MMRAVEVRGGKDSKENSDNVDEIARRHGFPRSLPAIVVDKFDESVEVFMTQNFKSAIPVRFEHIQIYNLTRTNNRSTVIGYGTTALMLGLPGSIVTIALRSVVCFLQC